MATGGAMSMKEIMAERAQRMKGRERREGQKEETKKRIRTASTAQNRD